MIPATSGRLASALALATLLAAQPAQAMTPPHDPVHVGVYLGHVARMTTLPTAALASPRRSR